MSPISARSHPTPSSMLILFLATGAGLAVAALYYNQPMLGILGADLHADSRTVGLVPMLTQLGYALGLLLLAPLGDRYDRRTIILSKAVVLALALAGAAIAPGVHALLFASLVVGLSATLAQDIVPASAALAPEARRGRVVGTVMTGLLLGILLSRVVSGIMAANVGWRAMFVVAAVSIALFTVIAWRQLPRLAPTTQLGYLKLLASLVSLWHRHPALRRAALAQGALQVAFSAFWSTMAIMLHAAPFDIGSAGAGAFGLAGAAGALAAPIAGRIADSRGAHFGTRLGTSIATVSFAAMFCMPLLSVHGQLILLALSAIGFDLGVQATLVSHQSIVYGLEPAARSRLNAVLFVTMFLGMALGAVLGSSLLAVGGWPAVVALSTLGAALAFVIRMWPATVEAVC
ncbi:putative MFS family arabinose efflux permease [Robbsia andropogonis]|uniref:MFS transporter n=1 Tax=Robbsia andropogonis TaxID=28092 RepID=UPI003D23D89D